MTGTEGPASFPGREAAGSRSPGRARRSPGDGEGQLPPVPTPPRRPSARGAPRGAALGRMLAASRRRRVFLPLVEPVALCRTTLPRRRLVFVRRKIVHIGLLFLFFEDLLGTFAPMRGQLWVPLSARLLPPLGRFIRDREGCSNEDTG